MAENKEKIFLIHAQYDSIDGWFPTYFSMEERAWVDRSGATEFATKEEADAAWGYAYFMAKKTEGNLTSTIRIEGAEPFDVWVDNLED